MFKWIAVAAALAAAALPVTLFLLVGVAIGSADANNGLAGGPSVLALSDIPPAYLTLFKDAAQTCPGLPWSVLAGIGKVESDDGQSTAPGVHSGANYAGAGGPMQFEPATFAQYAADADPSSKLSPYDPGDAIYTAASINALTEGAGNPQVREGVLRVLSTIAEVTVARPGRPAASPR